MTRISSRQTWFLKRVFPVMWFGILAVVGFAMLADSRPKPGDRAVAWTVLPAMALLGVFLYKWLITPLADEVWDAGSELVVRKKGVEAHVPLSQIMNVSYERFVNPPRATLMLREPSVLGSEIVFCPPARFVPLSRSPVVDDLIRRVDAARRR
jgi:hypothetical protein